MTSENPEVVFLIRIRRTLHLSSMYFSYLPKPKSEPHKGLLVEVAIMPSIVNTTYLFVLLFATKLR